MLATTEEERLFLEETARAFAPADAALADQLPRLYDELRRLAGGYFRQERSDHTLQPTALVHEAYLQLCGQHSVDWTNRAQFLGIAARIMRRILTRHAEARHAQKRGSGALCLSLDTAVNVFEKRDIAADKLNAVLEELEALDPRQGQIVELRFFGGLDIEETAAALGISPATVKREWTAAKLWLAREMR